MVAQEAERADPYRCNHRASTCVKVLQLSKNPEDPTTMKSNFETVRQETKRMSPSALVGKGRFVIGKLTDNPHFTDPKPDLAEMEAACAALETATQLAAFTRGRWDIAVRDEFYTELRHLLHLLGSYVGSRSAGDAELISSAGFKVKLKRQPSQPMEAPPNLRAKRSPRPGTLELRWGAVKNRRIYEVLMTTGHPTDADAWHLLGSTSRNHFTVEHLASDQVHYFRVQAIGALGAGPLSDISSAKAA